jgi:hypothetical protein
MIFHPEKVQSVFCGTILSVPTVTYQDFLHCPFGLRFNAGVADASGFLQDEDGLEWGPGKVVGSGEWDAFMGGWVENNNKSGSCLFI